MIFSQMIVMAVTAFHYYSISYTMFFTFIGLLIGIIQAATSINEMTLSFVPKLVIVVMTFGLMSSFMLSQLSDYFMFIFDQIANIS